MDLNLYQSLSQKTEKQYPREMRLSHAAIGLQTEIGEFATQVKRVSVYEKKLLDVKDGKTLVDHMIEELGDAMFYAVIPFNVFGTVAGDVLNTDSSWAMITAAQMGFPVLTVEELGSLNDAVRSALLLDVTLTLGVEIGRYIQNMEGSDTHAQTVMCSIIKLIQDACHLIGASFEDVLQQNIDKLQGDKGRYGSAGYSNAAAEARADKGGADARNS
jgi:NTP pyrophosphatase (non-canonical NTP hydrolase)